MIDRMCAEALERMRLASEARFEAFERASRIRYLFLQRSFAQRFRRLREELCAKTK
jgi:hypothetical protein